MTSIFKIFKKTENSFDGQEPGEKVIMLLRRHPFPILTKMQILGLVALIPIIIGIKFYPLLSSNGLFPLFAFLSAFFYSILWSGVFYSLTMYSLDVWIVTDRRIIDSRQNGFFDRKISELHLERMQDITIHTKGMVRTFLRFGDLQIQTAGTENKFTFIQIPNPEKVKEEIMKIVASKNQNSDKNNLSAATPATT